MTKKTYEEEAIKLSIAVDIAIEAFEKYQPEIWSEVELNHIIGCYQEWKSMALNPQPEFRKIASLKYKINDVFTYFQEASGREVEYFWKQIREQNLNYVREDKLGKIIKRGKIRNRIEFEYVTDLIVVAEQEKRITKNDVEKLSHMIGEFESRKRI